MTSRDRNFMVMVILLGISALFSISVYFADIKQSDTVQVKDFPRTIGSWSSQEIPLSKEDIAILETDNAFVRKYRNFDGQEVYLYIVYSQTNHKVTHPPEICYTGGGISILEKKQDSIPVSYKNLTISANRLLLEDDQLYQISFYWFKVGDIFTPNYWKEQILVALNAFLGKRQGSALIRISADVIDKNKEQSIQTVKGFAALITPLLFKYLP